MLTEFLERRRQNRALRKFSQSVLGDALRIHTQKYLNGTILRGLSSELKQNMVEQFSNRLIAIDKAPNPLLTFQKNCVMRQLPMPTSKFFLSRPRKSRRLLAVSVTFRASYPDISETALISMTISLGSFGSIPNAPTMN